MNISVIKNTSKYIEKKAHPERVAPSARLAGIKGTDQQRAQMALELNDKLFKLIHDIFEQKIEINKKNEYPSLTKKELMNCIKQVTPGVKIKMRYENRLGYFGSVERIFNKNKITGYVLSIKGKVKKRINEVPLIHEMQHIFDFITQPKMNARFNTDCLIGRIENYSRFRDVFNYKFYQDNLYATKRVNKLRYKQENYNIKIFQ